MHLYMSTSHDRGQWGANAVTDIMISRIINQMEKITMSTKNNVPVFYEGFGTTAWDSQRYSRTGNDLTRMNEMIYIG